MTTRIRIGILGTSRVARNVVPQIQQSELAEVVMIGSRSAEKAREFALEFGIPQSAGSYDEVLKSDCDAVYIPLPPALHCEWTCRAAEQGKHVLCEKPLATNAQDARQMIETCRSKNVVLLDSVMWYHTDRAAEMKRMVSEGDLGDLRQITSAFTFPGDLLADDNLRFRSDLGGGCLLDIGWYCVGASLWMMSSLPDRVFARAEWKHGVDWHLNGLMWFADEQVASIECGFNAIRRRWIEITGAKAALVCDDFTRPWNAEKPRFWIHDAQGVSHPHVIPHPPIERCLVDAFSQLVRERRVYHDWAELSLRTQHCSDALMKAAKNERIESVEPLAPLSSHSN